MEILKTVEITDPMIATVGLILLLGIHRMEQKQQKKKNNFTNNITKLQKLMQEFRKVQLIHLPFL
jgi:hypothetical protein